MRISIVVATFNRARLLKATLDRLRQQAYEPGDEVIVVDNGSTDATPEIIERAAAAFPVALHHLREPAIGKSHALKSGLGRAGGSILALTDDDVLVSDDWIAKVREIFAAEPTVALVAGRVDPKWERRPPRWLQVERGEQYSEMAAPLALLHYGPAQPLGERTAVGANMAVRREVAEAVGGFALHLGKVRGTLLGGEDHDFCQKVAAAGYRCEYRPDLRVQHWVPADRTRGRYYLRWFFWSGITNAVIDRGSGRAGRDMLRYFLRTFATAIAAAMRQLFMARTAAAAEQAMRAAFAAGYIVQRIGKPISDGRNRTPADAARSGVATSS